MLKNNITKERKERHHITQEDFTPDSIIDIMVQDLPDDLYIDFSKLMLDPCAGNGNILIYVFNKRLEYCKSELDVYNALSTIYGTELMEDNVQECYERFIQILIDCPFYIDEEKAENILKHNIVCTDTFKWDYENWEPIKEAKTHPLF